MYESPASGKRARGRSFSAGVTAGWSTRVRRKLTPVKWDGCRRAHQPQSRIQGKILMTLGFRSSVLGSGDTDEGSGCFPYPAGMEGTESGSELFQGEHVRTLYGKSTSRHLFRAV